MRAVNTAKIAAEAEILRLRAMLKRQGIRAAFGLLAVVFALGVLIFINILIWLLLRLYMQPIYATVILLAINLAIAVAFGMLAARSEPSHAEQAALELRQRAIREFQHSFTLSALLPLAGTILRPDRKAGSRRWLPIRERER